MVNQKQMETRAHMAHDDPCLSDANPQDADTRSYRTMLFTMPRYEASELKDLAKSEGRHKAKKRVYYAKSNYTINTLVIITVNNLPGSQVLKYTDTHRTFADPHPFIPQRHLAHLSRWLKK